jgi:hypothetical protein
MIIHYRKKNTFTKWIFLYSLLAYAIAIAAKEVIQIPTYAYILATNNLVYLGLYFGLQTVFLEVGLAYLFACFGVKKNQLSLTEASAYGAGLAFWENGVLLGLFSIISYIADYAVISSGGSTAQAVLTTIMASQPTAFGSPLIVLPGVALGTLERISSIFAHFAWGYLCVIAACTKQRKYFYIALPMGFLDFFVPFANLMPQYVFELIVFVWCFMCFILAKSITKNVTQ